MSFADSESGIWREPDIGQVTWIGGALPVAALLGTGRVAHLEAAIAAPGFAHGDEMTTGAGEMLTTVDAADWLEHRAVLVARALELGAAPALKVRALGSTGPEPRIAWIKGMAVIFGPSISVGDVGTTF